MMVTRAKALGIKPEKMAEKVKKVIAKQRNIMAVAAAPYAEIDGSVEVALKNLLAAFDDLTKEMDGSTEWLNEELEE